MKGAIALCITCAIVVAAVDAVDAVKNGIDPTRYWPFVWTGVFLSFALIAHACAKARPNAVPAAIHTP